MERPRAASGLFWLTQPELPPQVAGGSPCPAPQGLEAIPFWECTAAPWVLRQPWRLREQPRAGSEPGRMGQAGDEMLLPTPRRASLPAGTGARSLG